MTQTQPRVAVVGGGVIGVCCAYFLAKRGAAVTLLERNAIASGASGGNAGTIAPGHGPINKPGRLWQALKQMLDPTSPLYIAPRFDPQLARWLWTFSRYCTSAHLQSSLPVMGSLGHATRSLFDQLVEEEDLDCDFRTTGYYDVFRTSAGLATAKHEASAMRAVGFHPESLSGGALREREPALRQGIAGGVFYPEAATLNPHRFVLELAERAHRYGATIRTGSDVDSVMPGVGVGVGVRLTGLRLKTGEVVEADHVVLATGAYSLHLAGQLGCHLPIQAGKGYHRDRDIGSGGTPPLRVTCMLGEHSVFCTPMDGFVRYSGTMEFSGLNHVLRRPRLEQLTTAAKMYFDGVGDAPSRSEWCGLRPCTPDGLPIVGPVPGHADVFVATGHAMLGLTLGPITGRLISELVLDKRPSMDIHALRVGRF